MTDTLEAPQTGMDNYKPEMANSVFAPAGPEVAKNRPQEPAPEPKPKPEVQDTPKAPEAPKTVESKTSALSKLPSAKKPEAKPAVEPKPEEKKEEIKLTEEEGKKLPAFLREFYEKHKSLPDELSKIRGDFDTERKAHEMTRGEYDKLKALGLNEKERSLFQQYERMNAVSALQASEKYQKSIMAPILHRIEGIKSVAKNGKLDQAKQSALLNAVDIQDPWQRAKAIRGIVRGNGEEGDLEEGDYSSLADRAIKLADELNDEWYPKKDQAEAEAYDIEVAEKAKKGEESKLQKIREEEEMKKAKDEVLGILGQDKLKPLLEDKELALDGTRLEDAMKNATPADNPQDRAFEIMAPTIVAFQNEYINRLLQKVFDLEEANRIRNGVRPKPTDAKQPINEVKEAPVSADEVFKRRGANYLG